MLEVDKEAIAKKLAEGLGEAARPEETPEPEQEAAEATAAEPEQEEEARIPKSRLDREIAKRKELELKLAALERVNLEPAEKDQPRQDGAADTFDDLLNDAFGDEGSNDLDAFEKLNRKIDMLAEQIALAPRTASIEAELRSELAQANKEFPDVAHADLMSAFEADPGSSLIDLAKGIHDQQNAKFESWAKARGYSKTSVPPRPGSAGSQKPPSDAGDRELEAKKRDGSWSLDDARKSAIAKLKRLKDSSLSF